MTQSWQAWESKFLEKMSAAGNTPGAMQAIDPAHDLAHFGRVVATAKSLAEVEKARLEVVIPAAWMHDLVNVPKNDPRRSQASRLSAKEAIVFLREIGFAETWAPDLAAQERLLEDIGHAIEAHSFSANIEPKTVEAQIVQDADRLDGLGAIGVARCFAVAGLLGRQFYDPTSPFGEGRAFDDLVNTVDHFYVKLFKTVDTLKTAAGREEGRRRAAYMRGFLAELAREVGVPFPG